MVVQLLSWLDYTLFCLTFVVSIAIGIYYGCFGNKQSTTDDYLHGGKQMGIIPVGMSLIAGGLSGVTFLGMPSEVYLYGTQLWSMIFGTLIIGLIYSYLYLPVFYHLQLSSTYEYLERRFNKYVSKLASFLFIIATLLFLPIAIYGPTLAFNQVTGFKVHQILIIMSLVCIFYTTIGGFKSVIWTDTLQFFLTLCVLLYLLIYGTISVGGLNVIWEKAAKGDRIEFFNMNPNPTIRSTFWSVFFFQMCGSMTVIGINPSAVQRYLATSSLKSAKRTLLFAVVGIAITISIACFFGLIIYAKYQDCDPVLSKQITTIDQIMPYFVMDLVGNVPGVTGLFLAGMYSASLTSLSTFLNTLSGVIYTDFILLFLSNKPSERCASNVMKATGLIIGLMVIGLAFVMEKLGNILEIWANFAAITSGPLIGLFTLGMLFPFANSKGAFSGAITSVILIIWLAIKTKLLKDAGYMKYHPKPLNVDGCNFTSFLNETILIEATTRSPAILPTDGDIFWLYKISFYYYMIMGFLTTIIVGILVSWITGNNKEGVDLELISPCLHRFISNSKQLNTYQSVQNVITEENYFFCSENGRV